MLGPPDAGPGPESQSEAVAHGSDPASGPPSIPAPSPDPSPSPAPPPPWPPIFRPAASPRHRDERLTAVGDLPSAVAGKSPTDLDPASSHGDAGTDRGRLSPPHGESLTGADSPTVDAPRPSPHLDILHDYDDVQGHRVLRLQPTPSQWQDFPAVLAHAEARGAQDDGCFKVVIPDGLRDALPVKPARKVPANAYRVRQIRKTTFWQVSTVPSHGEFSWSPPGPEFLDSVDAAFKSLKRLFRSNMDRQMRNVRYRVDVPARSPIHPLKGDQLDRTRAVIPGIHTPYVYDSGPHFGATFQMQAEDFRLASLNHLYRGRKIWVVVPATAVDTAERALGRGAGCSQFMRHRAEFIFLDRLDKLGVPYRLVDQRPGETLVILPDAYHEGFSTGYTMAEAKNYADGGWNTHS